MTDYGSLPVSHAGQAGPSKEKIADKSGMNRMGATFDAGDARKPAEAEIPIELTELSGQSLSGLKKLQDLAKYSKARFSFRLYKK